MSDAKKFNAVSASTDTTGKSVLLTDDAGNISKMVPEKIGRVELTRTEDPQTTLEVVDFAKKYIVNKPMGTMLANTEHNTAVTWYVKLNDNVTIDTQEAIFLVGRSISLDRTWRNVSFLILPMRSMGTVYSVSLSTHSTAEPVTKSIYALKMEEI